jgi:hypothetical protein
MRIALTELEVNLMMSFNIYQYIHKEKSKDDVLEAITIVQSIQKYHSDLRLA